MAPSKNRAALRATLAGMLAILLWSSTVAVARSLSEQLGGPTAIAAVYLIGAFSLLLQRLFTHRPWLPGRGLRRAYLWGCGALFVFNTCALFQAIALAADRIQVLEVGMLNYLWPSLTLLFSLVLLGQRTRWWLLPGTVLALAGEILVLTHEAPLNAYLAWRHISDNPLAYGLALGAAFTWALYSNLARRWSHPEGGGAAHLFVLATGVVMLGVALLQPQAAHWTPKAVMEVVFMGGATAVAYTAWDVAMRRGDVVLVAACSYLTPLFSTLVACAYLGIVPDARLWMGCAILVIGSLLSWRAVTGCPAKVH